MGGMKKLSAKDRRIYQSLAAAFVLVCVVMGLLCFQYYIRLQDTVKTEGGGYMQEIANQMSTNVSKTINDNFAVLETMASVLKTSEVTTYNKLRTVVRDHQAHWNYQKLMVVDDSGIARDENGRAMVLSGDEYLQDAIVGKSASMSVSQVIDGQECIVFAIPLEGVVIEGTDVVALAAAYNLETFDTILSMTAFGGKSYAHIIRTDGTVVVRSSYPDALPMGYNILNSLASAQLFDGETVDIVKSDIQNGLSGMVEFAMDGAHEYMTYTPLEAHGWTLLTFVPVAVVNAKSEMLFRVTLLVCGFVTVGFSLLVAALVLVFYRNKRKLEHIAYVDSITGGNTSQRFYELAQARLEASNKPQYALVYTNIEKFKVLNEQFGRRACDGVLRSMEHGIGETLAPNECMGRLFADNFCVLVQYRDETELTTRFDQWQKNSIRCLEESGAIWLPLIVEFGVFVIGNDSIPIAHMVDRAKLALSESASELRGKLRYAIYDEEVRRSLFREKQLEDMMEDALANGEFLVYLQPKYHTQSETIGGAEALVRWRSAVEGMIFPDEFIPLFEKNGFVIQLDLFVFAQVCRTLRGWLDEGLEPVKVSVNCSRMHLKNPNFLDEYVRIAQEYAIPEKYLEIELTENTVFGDVEHLSQVIRNIHLAGFGCSMDDFGSGYSSLNLIQDIPVDTLKLDKVFFRTGSKDLQRTESVVGSIIAMSKALSMETVAEGIEERPQVEMLKQLDCDYIQGYYFAKPMPIAAFERLAFPEAREGSGQ